MDSTANGLNPEWTQPRLGLNPEWIQPQLGFNPNWDSTPNGLNRDWDSIQDELRMGLNLEFLSTLNGTISRCTVYKKN
jgi:hypothetical protein